MHAMAAMGVVYASSAAAVAQEKAAETLTPLVVFPVAEETAPFRASDGRYHIAYELVLSNTIDAPEVLEGIAILDAADGSDILSLSAEELIADEAVRTLNREPVTDLAIQPSQSRVILLTTSFASAEDVPSGLMHRFDFVGPSVFSPEETSFSIDGGAVSLAARPAPVISAPLQGVGWIAAEGCCHTSSHHRNGVFPINGGLFAGQRFAIDFIQIDDEGRLAVGDYTDVNNWIGYDAPVLAASDGTVVHTLDGLPDQKPGIQPDQAGVALDEIIGNHIMLDHGDGFFTVYGHLKPESVAVAPGDSVKAGDVIGRVGSTGGSLAPHLHFHVVDSRMESAANGYPFVFAQFDLSGGVDAADLLNVIQGEATFPARASLTSEPRTNELPLSYAIVDFPE